jgi:hypothetical protein
VKKFDRIPIPMVWKAVEAAYKQAGVKPSFIEPSLNAMSYVASPAGKKIGNPKIVDDFDCGGDKKAPLAATIPLSVNVRTVVKEYGEGSEVTTTVVGTPIAPEDGSVPPVCISRGKLERKLEPQIKIAFVIRKAGS